MEYELFAKPDNVNRGFYDASSSPVLSIQSGDTLRVHTESGLEEHLELVGERASDEFRAIITSNWTWPSHPDRSYCY